MPSTPPWCMFNFVLAGAILTLACGCGNSSSEVREPVVALSPPIVLSTELPPVFTDDTREVTAEIPVRNPTSDTLRITEISSSCGCLSAELGSSHLGPLKETTLRLRIGVSGQVGRRTLHGRLKTDREFEFEYQVAVTVLQRIETEHYDWSFGSLHTSEKVIRDILIRTHALAGVEPPRILDVNTEYGGLQCSIATDQLLPPSRGVATREVTLRLALMPEATIGSGSAYVHVNYQYGKEKSVKTLPVFWRVDSLYHFHPARVVCVSTSGKISFEREITIQRRDGAAFRVQSIECSSEWINVRIASTSTQTIWRLIVMVDGSSQRVRVLLGQVTIMTDVVDEPTVTVPIVMTRLADTEKEVSGTAGQ